MFGVDQGVTLCGLTIERPVPSLIIVIVKILGRAREPCFVGVELG